MARLLLLADSNFVDNARKFTGPKVKSLEVKNCQNKMTVLNEVSVMTEGILVFACIDLIAAEAAQGALGSQDAAAEMAFNQVIWKIIDLLNRSNGKLACGIIAPIFWRSHSRMTRRGIHHAYQTALKNPVPGLFMTEYHTGLSIGRDRVHLVPRSAMKYVQSIYEAFRTIDQQQGYSIVEFESPDFTLTPANARLNWEEDEDEDMDEDTDIGMEIFPPTESISPNRTLSMASASILTSMPSLNRIDQRSPTRTVILTGGNNVPIGPNLAMGNPGVRFNVPPPGLSVAGNNVNRNQLTPAPIAWPTMLTPELSTSLTRIEQRLGVLESKSLQDNLMMATIKEEQDAEANRNMLDRLTIMGIKITDVRKMKEAEKIPIMKSKLEELLQKLKEEGQAFEVVFVRHLNRQSKGQNRNQDYVIMEARFASAKQASDIRTNFIKKRNAPGLDGINITPAVRLSTRVRIELMQAVATELKKSDREITKTQCVQFVPKPVLKIFRNDSRGNEYSRIMTFSDCVVWVIENDAEKRLNLTKAYECAGSAFRGMMPQHFVIMS